MLLAILHRRRSDNQYMHTAIIRYNPQTASPDWVINLEERNETRVDRLDVKGPIQISENGEILYVTMGTAFVANDYNITELRLVAMNATDGDILWDVRHAGLYLIVGAALLQNQENILIVSSQNNWERGGDDAVHAFSIMDGTLLGSFYSDETAGKAYARPEVMKTTNEILLGHREWGLTKYAFSTSTNEWQVLWTSAFNTDRESQQHSVGKMTCIPPKTSDTKSCFSLFLPCTASFLGEQKTFFPPTLNANESAIYTGADVVWGRIDPSNGEPVWTVSPSSYDLDARGKLSPDERFIYWINNDFSGPQLSAKLRKYNVETGGTYRNGFKWLRSC